ncbi:adenine phosphoribosyltransferase [Stigmatella sp. ncwal1]|uniref:Adenine phosphoribosyltransferase n=1 Tax=Stigmatella ashevillensis TaxID=2995309 RepID=A0ABT5DAU7_9BACT|nr:adenine phosphoribosyltransferase [Stigmatella ashevillena]MDC0709411.1 adenine phosphoribosyltransferase [Stigmatella ashevillena]
MSAETPLATELQARMRDVPDFPRPGIVFKDITPVLADPLLFHRLVHALAEPFRDQRITKVIGVEARGFILGAPVALALNAGFVPARKPGKLPHRTVAERYSLEYGSDGLEMHQDAVLSGERAIIVDDVLATGGTAEATAKLLAQVGGELVGFSFLIALGFLEGVKRLGPQRVHSLITL